MTNSLTLAKQMISKSQTKRSISQNFEGIMEMAKEFVELSEKVNDDSWIIERADRIRANLVAEFNSKSKAW